MKIFVDELPNNCYECVCKQYSHHTRLSNGNPIAVYTCLFTNEMNHYATTQRGCECPLTVLTALNIK